VTNDYVPNPLVDVVVELHEVRDEPVRIDVSSYSNLRGFNKVRLTRGDGAAFDAALRFLFRDDDDAERAATDLAAREKQALWQAGLIVRRSEIGDPIASPKFDAATSGSLGRDGFIVVDECITPSATARVAKHFKKEIACGRPQRRDHTPDRHVVHNDPAARIIQRELLGAVERIVGSPIKSSYAYALLYRGGAILPAHTDRQPNKYTVSLLIDHLPTPSNGCSPWPFHLFPDRAGPPVECFERIGGGIVFRGGEILHGRPRLPDGEECWTFVLGYVDAGYGGNLE
jgi:hypothetical protein